MVTTGLLRETAYTRKLLGSAESLRSANKLGTRECGEKPNGDEARSQGSLAKPQRTHRDVLSDPEAAKSRRTEGDQPRGKGAGMTHTKWRVFEGGVIGLSGF